MMTKRNEFRVIKIPSNSSVVINGGQSSGLREGDELEVYVTGESITDPFTGEKLGTLDYVKAELEIVHLLPKMSVCKNAHTRQFDLLTDTIIKAEREVRKPLKINPGDITGEFANQDSAIAIGDTVRLKLDPES